MSRKKWTRRVRDRLLPIVMALAVIFGTATTATLASVTPAQADTTSDTEIASAVTWAENQMGSTAWDGLCLVFVYDAYLDGTSSVNIGGADTAYDYWTNHSSAQVTDGSTPPEGALVFWGPDPWSSAGHVALSLGGGTVISSEERSYTGVHEFTIASRNNGGYAQYYEGWMMPPGVSVPSGSSGGSGGSGGGTPPPPPSRQLVINNTAAWAEDSIANTWTQETVPNDVQAVSVGGNLMMVINGCGAVYATTVIAQTSGWIKETGCGAAKAIAASANGTQMYLDYCNRVNAEQNPGMNWTAETTCGTAQAIAVGSNGIQMLIDACSAVYAMDSIATSGWNVETGCGTAKAIAAGQDETQVILNACNAVYAQNGISTVWNMEQNCGAAQAIAAAGPFQLLINACGEVYAAFDITANWTPETNCNAATAIAVGYQGRQLYIGGNGHVYAEESVTFGNNWTDETPSGATTAIAVG